MAFAFNNAPASNTTAQAFEKAVGYINASVPLEDGRHTQIGKGIALQASVDMSADLHEYLASLSQEEANAWLQANVKLTFWNARTAPSKKIRFG